MKREGIAHGQIEMIEYDSKTVGTKRKMQVYTLPGYSKEKHVPHVWHVDGNAHDSTEWKNNLYLFAQRIFK